jgi:Phage integrase family
MYRARVRSVEVGWYWSLPSLKSGRGQFSAATPEPGDRKWPRASLADLDFRDGFVTLHERKKSRETKTTRRVPMSGLFKRVMREWVKGRSGPLFSQHGEPFTPKALHHYFEYPLEQSKWKDLRGWHVFRHSYISCLACKGVDQRIDRRARRALYGAATSSLPPSSAKQNQRVRRIGLRVEPSLDYYQGDATEKSRPHIPEESITDFVLSCTLRQPNLLQCGVRFFRRGFL